MDVEEIKKDAGNKELVMKAVQESGLLLEWASPELQDDKELVLNAVKQNPGALEFASKRLKDD